MDGGQGFGGQVLGELSGEEGDQEEGRDAGEEGRGTVFHDLPIARGELGWVLFVLNVNHLRRNPMSISEGTQAPDFCLPDAGGTLRRLSDFRGKYVVVYFYPKDDTPGCTKEACGFRDLHETFTEKNAVVLGVSPDGSADHGAFIGKYGLPFTLLCDEDTSVMKTYGAWGEKNMYGKISVGVIRSTVLVDPEGRVVKHWRKVAGADKHPAQVLAVLESL